MAKKISDGFWGKLLQGGEAFFVSMSRGFLWVGYPQLGTRCSAVLLWTPNNSLPPGQAHFSSGFSGFGQTQNLILLKGFAWANTSSLKPQLDIWKFVTSTGLVSIYKNHLNNLWERMLYKCKILIHMVLSGVWWQNRLIYTYSCIMFYFIHRQLK